MFLLWFFSEIFFLRATYFMARLEIKERILKSRKILLKTIIFDTEYMSTKIENTCLCVYGSNVRYIDVVIVTFSSNLDDCLNNPCKNGGSCTNTADSYTCSCVFPWEGQNCRKYKQFKIFQ